MNRVTALLIVLLGFCSTRSPSRAEIIPKDDVLRAVVATGTGLAKGENRQELLASLGKVLRGNPKSDFLKLAESLEADLRESVDRAKALPRKAEKSRRHPERYLMESSIPPYQLVYHPNWQFRLEEYRIRHPDDPAVASLTAGRDVIKRLIPALEDRSPVRSFQYLGGLNSGRPPRVPRTCDYALILIEFHSRCIFHDDRSGELFHAQSDESRRAIIERIKRWWKQNNMSTTATGIRNLLSSGWETRRIVLCDNLIELGDADDAEYANRQLREIVAKYPTYTQAAIVLAKHGDLSPLDLYFKTYSEEFERKRTAPNYSVMGYMTEYGGRREWEFLTKIAECEVAKRLEPGQVLSYPAFVNCDKSKTSPWAIPALGSVLTQTATIGSRGGVEGVRFDRPQPFSYADVAIELLQKRTGEDFAYDPASSAEKRAAAIRRAQQWWNDEGKSKFTFDAIQRRVKK